MDESSGRKCIERPRYSNPEAFHLLRDQVADLTSLKTDVRRVALFKGVVAIARHGNPEVRLDSINSRIHQLAYEVHKRKPHQYNSGGRFIELNKLLFDQIGFHLMSKEQPTPNGNLIHKVIENHVGTRPLLSLFYKLIADRLEGVTVWGCNIPNLFMIGVQRGTGRVFLDPATGREQAEKSLKEHFQNVRDGTTWSHTFLEPIGYHEWLTVLLEDLRLVYRKTQQFRHEQAMYEMLMLLWPDRRHLYESKIERSILQQQFHERQRMPQLH